MRESGSRFPSEYPCPVCGELRKMGITKKEKPYFQCETCGVQVFIRGKWGISLLSEIKNNTELSGKIESLGRFDSYKLLQFQRRIHFLQQQIKELNSRGFNFELSREEKRQKSQLASKLKELEAEYTALLLDEKPLPNNESGV